TPHSELKKLQDEGRFTELLAMQEKLKMMPVGAVYEHFLNLEGKKSDFMPEILKYEKEVLSKRV
ncbi:MAG: L-rhamnose isomerase, partial [Clostridia bacterium]|nr:L-rhamnose isomerase [Clostridia bacterium]